MKVSGNREFSPRGALLMAWLFLSIFASFGVFLICFEVKAFQGAERSKSWPKTTGILTVVVGDYRREISYTYTVNDSSYSSDRVMFGELGNRTPTDEWRFFASQPNGLKVDVFYMPERPWESTLVKGRVDPSSFGRLIQGSCFIMLGFLGFFIGMLARKNATKRGHAK